MTHARERHYVNLTNGLESLPELVDAGASWSFLRLQSTTIERQDWIKLFLTDLSDDLLPTPSSIGADCFFAGILLIRPGYRSSRAEMQVQILRPAQA